MINWLTKLKTSQAIRHYARVMAFAVLGIILISLVARFFPSKPVVYVSEDQVEDPVVATSTFARSAPIRLVIPKIDLDTTFEAPLGLNTDQTVSVPESYNKVGWYKNGATPGEIGPAVILGHVDSYRGVAVFFLLGQLEAGDEVEVTREDGTVATFVVTSKERVLQSEFPTEKVYGDIDHAGLRLVTCTGVYDKGDLRYSHNLIVYAELKTE